ncbi:MAG: aminotransferase class I/II-fold pyridoxal phosphate-dependent enzyme [Planctomycetota bacterium]
MNPPVAYAPPAFPAPISLDLSRNEGRPPRGLPDACALDARELSRYPAVDELRAALAARHDVGVDRVLVTNGADDALLRLCLWALRGGGAAMLPVPTFEMIERYVAIAGGTAIEVDWPEGPFPTAALRARARPDVRLVFVVSPNNPTGATASAADLEELARALPDATIVLDAAYAEFADVDLTGFALRRPQFVVVRTLSKAWGLAGLRVGYALGAPATIAALRAHGNPMPVAALAARIALQRLRDGAADVADHVAAVRAERAALLAALTALGAAPARPSEGNFVLARGVDAAFVVAAAAAQGVGLRRFPGRAGLRDAVRIGLPGEADAFGRLLAALRAALAPPALLFDLDGVLVDVSGSYRHAIVATARAFGVDVAPADVAAAKARGNANDDWSLTHRLITAAGVRCALGEVVERFEACYRSRRDGERALVAAATLRAWGRARPLAVVTGRPAADAAYVLERLGLAACFDAVVCREDAALKPDPAPVRLALRRLGVDGGWMLGDTVDDVAAARAAGVVPIGVVAPGDDQERAQATLAGAGAARVLLRAEELGGLLR